MSNHVSIDGYVHISHAAGITNKKLKDIRDGLVTPIRTSSKKENDKIGGFFPSDQIVLAARTGMGKSAKVLIWLKDFVDTNINPAYKDKLIVLYDSWEMPEWRNMLRLYSRELEMDVKTILDYNKANTIETFNRIQTISQSFLGYPVYFRNISENVKAWEKRKRATRKLFPKHTILNVVDHTRLVTKENERSEEEMITNFMKAGMRLKIEDDMINIFLSQMNRAVETAGARTDIGKNLPVSSDIFGSDGVFQCADVVMALHRPGFYNLTEFNGLPTGINKDDTEQRDHLMIECILKQRDGWTGNLLMRHNLAHNSIIDYV